jgi:hypothetical protein
MAPGKCWSARFQIQTAPSPMIWCWPSPNLCVKRRYRYGSRTVRRFDSFYAGGGVRVANAELSLSTVVWVNTRSLLNIRSSRSCEIGTVARLRAPRILGKPARASLSRIFMGHLLRSAQLRSSPFRPSMQPDICCEHGIKAADAIPMLYGPTPRLHTYRPALQIHSSWRAFHLPVGCVVNEIIA